MPRTRIYLVRHAKAEETRSGGDAARRLTTAGRARFRALATSIAPRLELSRIVTSPLVRARQTAEILGDATGASIAEDEALAPGRSTGNDLIALARRAGAGTALVGHNPEIADAVAIAAGHEEKVRPGTVAAIDLAAGAARLAWLEAPPKE